MRIASFLWPFFFFDDLEPQCTDDINFPKAPTRFPASGYIQEQEYPIKYKISSIHFNLNIKKTKISFTEINNNIPNFLTVSFCRV